MWKIWIEYPFLESGWSCPIFSPIPTAWPNYLLPLFSDDFYVKYLNDNKKLWATCDGGSNKWKMNGYNLSNYVSGWKLILKYCDWLIKLRWILIVKYYKLYFVVDQMKV